MRNKQTIVDLITGLTEMLANWGMTEATKELSARELKVMHLRFVEQQTLEKVAKEFMVTRSRISEIEEKAINKIKEYSIN